MKWLNQVPKWLPSVIVLVVAGLLGPNSLAQEGSQEPCAKLWNCQQVQGDGVADSSRVAEPAAPALPSRHVKDDYLIGDEDVLAISVWHETEISRVVPVRPDGKISVPLLGEIRASGLTPKQLQAAITEGLRKYLDHPEVTVIVQEAKSPQFNIVGEVLKPGSYLLGKPVTVLDAIVLAGGFREFAKQKKIYILRTQSDGSEQRISFNYKDVIKGRKISQNILLQPRDTVVVP
jgi:polysaccharide biosynthesis/export protein